jgi:hypothetical protein
VGRLWWNLYGYNAAGGCHIGLLVQCRWIKLRGESDTITSLCKVIWWCMLINLQKIHNLGTVNLCTLCATKLKYLKLSKFKNKQCKHITGITIPLVRNFCVSVHVWLFSTFYLLKLFMPDTCQGKTPVCLPNLKNTWINVSNFLRDLSLGSKAKQSEHYIICAALAKLQVWGKHVLLLLFHDLLFTGILI